MKTSTDPRFIAIATKGDAASFCAISRYAVTEEDIADCFAAMQKGGVPGGFIAEMSNCMHSRRRPTVKMLRELGTPSCAFAAAVEKIGAIAA